MLFFRRPQTPPHPPLRLHNTLSGKLETFVPLSPEEVKMYNCGPTPYDEQHIGNMVPPILANLLRRTLETWGYTVKQVMNVTDFGHLSGDNDGNPDIGEDKMSRGLRQEGMDLSMENMHILAEKYTTLFLSDVALLGIDNSTVLYPRASEYIPEEIALIQSLEQKGYAYKTSDGVYYDVSRFPTYGKLGGIDLSSLKPGARVEGSTEKRTPYDFVLWKFDSSLGWDSPWGKGFPGWHIECTAMVFTLLGRQIDIHTGGIEHIPIHHNNEIAQAEAISGKQYVRYWLHNAHIILDGKKISKSLGNTVYLRNLIDRGFSPRAFRYWYLTGHYRTPQNFTWEALEGANTALLRLQRFFFEELGSVRPSEKEGSYTTFMADFLSAIADDLNTPKALARVWEMVRDTSASPATKKAALLFADKILGLGLSGERPATKLKITEESDIPENIRHRMREREEARVVKDFARADTLRRSIEEAGYDIEDSPEGPILRRR